MNPCNIKLNFMKNSKKLPMVNIKSNTLDFNFIVQQDGIYEYSFDAPLGYHDLSICLTNKANNDTIVVGNDIVEDLAINIEEFTINGLDIKHQIDKFSQLTDNNGNVIDTYGWLSFNNPIHIIFQTPGMIFNRNLKILPIDYSTMKEHLFRSN